MSSKYAVNEDREKHDSGDKQTTQQSSRKIVRSPIERQVKALARPASTHHMLKSEEKLEVMEQTQDSSDQLNTALTYLPKIVVRDIATRMKEGRPPVRQLGEFGHEEFNGACAFFDISGFSKLASKLGKREREETQRRQSSSNLGVKRNNSFATGLVRGNSLLGKNSKIGAKNLMLSRSETIARQHETSLKLLPKILSERRGMGAETLAYAIKELFGKLVDKIQAAGGDIIKFAGDALICVWAGNSKVPVGVLVYHAIQCGFELSTHVESISLGRLESTDSAGGTNLHMHVSVGSGPMRLVHVGGESGRWEYFVAGDGVTRACDGVDLSKPGEIVVCKNSYLHLEKSLKRAARMLGETLQEGQMLRGGEYHMLTALDAPLAPIKPWGASTVRILPPLLAYCPANVKRAISNDASSEDSIRDVAVLFVLFNGMDKLKEAEHVGKVDGIFRSLQRSIYMYGGILRQFVVDDKGAVAVIVVGFPYFNYSKSIQASKAVGIALDIRKNMREIKIDVRCGITNGTVFCGNVGNEQRREYAAVGADVNLSARFMGKDKIGRILCDNRTAEAAAESYRFSPLGHKLELKGVEKRVLSFWPKSFGRRRTGQNGRTIVGRNEETGICLKNDSAGKIICFTSLPGFGKTALLQHVKTLAETNCSIMPIKASGQEKHLSINFYPWRSILSAILLPQSQQIHKNILECTEGLFNPCNIDAAQAEDVGDGQKAFFDESSVEPSEDNTAIIEFLATHPTWEHTHLLRHVVPALGIPAQKRTSNDLQIDGMLLSCEEFRQLGTLFATIMKECLSLDSVLANRILLVFDDVDLFDRHSLLLLNYFVKQIPAQVTVVCSSTIESSLTKKNMEDQDEVVAHAVSRRKSITKRIHFPFPPLNFRNERHSFFVHTMMNAFGMAATVVQMTSITLIHAIEVFKHIFGETFGKDVASKAIALSGGNLIMARKFLQLCLSTTGLLVKKVDEKKTTSLCFSPGVTDGSLKLPGVNSVTLDLFDVFTRELAQILSVLGVEVDMRALLSIDMLFQSNELSDNSHSTVKVKKINRTISSPSHHAVDGRVNKIENALARLVAAEILICIEISVHRPVQKKSSSSYEWAFASTSVRAEIYSSLTFGVRQSIHAALTQYYRLTYPDDLEYFAYIICYHAEASGDIKQALKTCFESVLLHEKRKRYQNAHDNLQRCIGLLQQNMKTKQDVEFLLGCYLKDAYTCIVMGKLEYVCVSLEKAETTCQKYAENKLPNQDGTTNRLSGLAKVFQSCKNDKVRYARKIIFATLRVMVLREKTNIEVAEGCMPRLKLAYEQLLKAVTNINLQSSNASSKKLDDVDEEWKPQIVGRSPSVRSTF